MEIFFMWFNMLKVRNQIKYQMLKKYNVQEIFLSRSTIERQFNLSKEEIEEIKNKEYYNKAKEVLKYNKENGIGVISIGDRKYPDLLRYIYNPPIVIYYKGNIDILNNRFVSICCGKNMDKYGQKILKYIVDNLYKDNIGIVTKFEEYNRKIFMQNVSRPNILVLSSGIKERFYTSKGVILSEHEPYIESSRDNIINRNRIISGITKETILIQTTIEDGVAYIVDNVLQENRELWVVPSNITKSINFYTNELIKQGANVLTQYNNLLVYEQKTK